MLVRRRPWKLRVFEVAAWAIGGLSGEGMRESEDRSGRVRRISKKIAEPIHFWFNARAREVEPEIDWLVNFAKTPRKFNARAREVELARCP